MIDKALSQLLMSKKFQKLTKAVHAGVAPDKKTGAILTPVYNSTVFVHESVEKFCAKGAKFEAILFIIEAILQLYIL